MQLLYDRPSFTNVLTKFGQANSCPLHYRHEHLLLPACGATVLDPGFPDLLQLCPPQHHLHVLFHVQIRYQGMGSHGLERWMEILKSRTEWGTEQHLTKDFIEKLFQLIHEESIRTQIEIMKYPQTPELKK